MADDARDAARAAAREQTRERLFLALKLLAIVEREGALISIGKEGAVRIQLGVLEPGDVTTLFEATRANKPRYAMTEAYLRKLQEEE